MNMRYAKRSEDTEQINVVSWAGLEHEPLSGIKVVVPCAKRRQSETNRRQSNSNRWVSRRAFLICASRTRKAHTAGYL